MKESFNKKGTSPMADETPAAPAEITQTSESVADTSTNNNSSSAAAGSSEKTQPQSLVPDMHGFTSEELASMRVFFDNNGGYEKVKSRLSNPTPASQPQQPTFQKVEQPQQPVGQPIQQTTQPPKGFASLRDLQVKSYFTSLAADPKYANIADKISNGEILKEMDSFGMTPIDGDYNINVEQINRFLDLKSASVPAKPATTEVNTTPTADYTPVEGEITSVDQAWQVLRENVMYTSQGKAPNPALAQAEDYLKKHGQLG